jgi:hypothetical protein
MRSLSESRTTGKQIAPPLPVHFPVIQKRSQPSCPKILGIAALSAVLFGAEYQSQNVDGARYFGFVRSLQTGKYYSATVLFKHNHAEVRLKSHKNLDLTLDQQTIQDPEEVLATDPDGGWWALSIDGLDEPSARSVTTLTTKSAPRSR